MEAWLHDWSYLLIGQIVLTEYPPGMRSIDSISGLEGNHTGISQNEKGCS